MKGGVSESLLVVMVFTLIFRYLQFYWKRKQTQKVSGVLGLPFIGDAIVFVQYYLEILTSLIQIITKTNPDWYGPPVGVFLRDPKDIGLVLGGQKTIGKDPKLYKVVVPFVGHGLLTSDVPTWRRDRKWLSPTFNQKNITGYYDIFDNNARIMVKDLRKEVDKGLFNVYHYISIMNLKTICETALGVIDSPNKTIKYPELIHVVDKALELITNRLTNIWYFFDFFYNLSNLKTETVHNVTHYQGIMDSILMAGQAKVNQKQNKSDDMSRVKTKYLMEELLAIHAEGKGMTKQGLKDHLNTVVFAGYETSAATLSFTMVLLGIYPEIQKKVYEEVLEVVGPSRPIEYDDLKNLQFMERVIKETLRFFPVAPFIARVTEEDMKLATRTVSAGTTLIVGILSVHKDPNIWPNPDKFDPDRFLPEEISKRHPYSWVPFSAGPRNCLGIRYAWISMKVMLTSILQAYEIESCYNDIKEIPMTDCIVSKPSEGFLIQIKNRA